ncbi:MAG: PAS domain S-box protein [Planctomycetota bacterium]
MSDRQQHERLQETLECTQRRLEVLLDVSFDAIISLDEEGNLTRWNRAAESMFGWRSEQVCGRSLVDLIVPEQLKKWNGGLRDWLVEVGPKQSRERLEMRAIRRNGALIDIEVRGSVLKLATGAEQLLVIRDISDIEASRRVSEDRESRFEALLHSTAEGIYGLDLEGHCTFANDACARLLGYASKEELQGAEMHQLIHHTRPDGTPYRHEACHIHRAIRLGEGVHVDDEVLWRKDDTSFPAEYWSYPVHIGGELVGAVVSFLDISERRELERTQGRIKEELEVLVAERTSDLAAMRDRLELALGGGNVGLWDWNAETNEVYFSETYKRQLGYPIETQWAHFLDWESRLHPDDHERSLKRVQDYFESPIKDYVSTFRLRCFDGSYRWFLAQGKGSFDASGRPLRMIGVHIDITQRKQDQQELERLNDALQSANDALQQSNVELQQFAYVASHDLQTPLRSIVGFAQFLESDYGDQLDTTASEYIERIVNGAKRMQKMINDLLAYSRVESHAEPFGLVDMNVAFDDAVGLLGSLIDQTNASVTCDSLPEVTGDFPQLVQLLQNIIGNGLKYCDVQPRIHVSFRELPEYWEFKIVDNGIGIEGDQQEKIFDIFQRLHSNEKYPGTGIGLAVCRRILNRHAGKIWVESQLERGSEFYFTIPK